MEKTDYLPPWRARDPDGGLGDQYGPRTLETYRRHVVSYENWAWRPTSKVSRTPVADRIVSFMRSDKGVGVPEMERRVYICVFENGHSARYCARLLNLHRSTVRTYINRLKDRAGG